MKSVGEAWQVSAWEGGGGRPGRGRYSSPVPMAHQGVRAQCHVHRFPGDPRDKDNIPDNLNHQRHLAAEERLPFFLPPLLLSWRLAPQDSALSGHQALLAHQGVRSLPTLMGECKAEALDPWLHWVKAATSRKPSLVPLFTL